MTNRLTNLVTLLAATSAIYVVVLLLLLSNIILNIETKLCKE